MPRLSFQICGVVKSRCYGGHLGTTMAGNWPTKPSESPATSERKKAVTRKTKVLEALLGCVKKVEETKQTRSSMRSSTLLLLLLATQQILSTSRCTQVAIQQSCRGPQWLKLHLAPPAPTPCPPRVPDKPNTRWLSPKATQVTTLASTASAFAAPIAPSISSHSSGRPARLQKNSKRGGCGSTAVFDGLTRFNSQHAQPPTTAVERTHEHERSHRRRPNCHPRR